MDMPNDIAVTDDEVKQLKANDIQKHYQNISYNEMSEEILQLIITSVEKKHRSKSVGKKKRKRCKINSTEVNGSDGDDERRAYSRCSLSFMAKVLNKVRSTPKYVDLVRWMGFDELLHLDGCCVPRSFVQWVADHVCTDEQKIEIGLKSIYLTPESVTDTLGTPNGSLLVDSDEETGKLAFLAKFGLSEVPSIRFFGKKILAKEVLDDDVFCRCFMSVCLGTFFCPNSNTKISTKYMGALVDVHMIKDRNWSKFIHEWLMLYIKKYLKDPSRQKQLSHTLGGCIYHLAVRCLDFVDFSPIHLPPTLPRIRVWKGNLIKVFSDMFLGTDGKYGAYPISDISQTCYGKTEEQTKQHESVLKISIDAAITDLVGTKLKDLISEAFVSTMKNEDIDHCKKAENLVVQVVQAFLSEKNGSQDTVKISSEEEFSYKSAHDSHTTEKIETDNEEIFEEDRNDQELIRRKRRNSNEVYSPEQSNESKSKRRRTNNSEGKEPTELIQDSSGTKISKPEGVQSASFQDFIPICNRTKSKAPEDVSSQQKEGTSILMDLNKISTEQEIEGFSGFYHNRSEQHEENLDMRETDNLEVAKDIDMNLPNIQIFAEHYARTQLPLEPSTLELTKGEQLQLARKKYFFFSDDTPTFRLFEDVDDNGRTIEEPELYRPLGMDDYTYNLKCESALKNNGETNHTILGKNEVKSPSTAEEHMSKLGSNSENCSTSIQCAQKEPDQTGLTESPKWQFQKKDNFIDLLTPEASNTTYNRLNSKDNSSPVRKTFDYSRALIIGRRLFDGTNDDKEFNDTSYESPSGLMLSKNAKSVSPEVEFLGEKVFKSTCNIMSHGTDDLYNTKLSLMSSSSSYGKENHLPQRIPERSKFARSPYDAKQKVSIQPIHQKVWEAVTTLCDIEPEKFSWAINIDNIRVSMLQLGSSMKLDGWVEAWLINAFCRKLFRDNHPRKTNKHFFFNTVSDYFLEKWKTESAMKYWKEKAIESFNGANKARALHLSDGLYFPTVFDDHWFVMLVDLKYRNFIFLDSVFGEESSYHRKVDKTMIQNFQHTWKDAGLKRMNFENFGRAYPNVPKQETMNDCGICVMKYMEWYCARNPAQCVFSHLDIPSFRIRYAHDILLSEHNMEHDAKDLACTFDPKKNQ